MRRNLALLCLPLLWLAAGEARASFRPVEVAAPSGVKAWLAPDATVPVFHARVVFTGVGYAHEPEEKRGLAAFVCPMLMEGAGELDGLAFHRRLEAYAIDIGCRVDEDNLTLTLKTLKEHQAEAFRLLSLVLTQPRLEEAAAVRVRGRLKAGLRSSLEEPEYLAGRALKRRLFGAHPYHRMELDGDEAAIDRLTPADARTFVGERLTRANAVISVAGDIDAETLAPLLESTFGGLPAAMARPAALPAATPAPAGSEERVREPIPHVFVGFVLPGIRREDPDYMAAFVLNHILGGGTFGSRLMHEIREKNGLVYGVNMYLEPLAGAGVWWGGFSAAREGGAQALALLRAELAKIHEHGVTAAELADARRYLTGNFPLNLDTNAKVAGFLTSMQLFNLGIDYLEQRNAQLEAVTLTQVNAVARRLLDPAALHVAIVSPEPEETAP